MASKITAGTASPADVLTGTTFSAGTNWNAAGAMPNYGNGSGQSSNPMPTGYYTGMPNQGSPTFTPGGNPISLPAGYYQGGTVGAVDVKVASGAVTSNSATAIFTLLGGSTVTTAYLTVPVPSGATAILYVSAGFKPPASGSWSQYCDYVVANSSGYLDGQNASAVCVTFMVDGTPNYTFAGTAPFQLSTSGIVIPTASTSTSLSGYQYTVFYV